MKGIELGLDGVRCGGAAPGHAVGCVRLAGHHRDGIMDCLNASTGQRWCGFCVEWSCEKHGVNGQPHKTPHAWELDRALGLEEAK